jgi:hypothetical protein
VFLWGLLLIIYIFLFLEIDFVIEFSGREAFTGFERFALPTPFGFMLEKGVMVLGDFLTAFVVFGSHGFIGCSGVRGRNGELKGLQRMVEGFLSGWDGRNDVP